MNDEEHKPIGDLIDGLGVTVDLGEGTLVSSAVVLLATVDSAGVESVQHAWSTGQSWIVRRGMLEAVRDAERLPPDTDDADG